MKIQERMKLNADGTYDVDGNVRAADLKPFIKDGKLTISFNKVEGSFVIKNLPLTTLEGCPKKVTGTFTCTGCDIETMAYCPQEIERDLEIVSCKKLQSLEGCPENINKRFKCGKCDNITSLKGIPKTCSRCRIELKNLQHLDFLPKVTEGISIVNCPNLESLQGFPTVMEGCFECKDCDKITSLEYAPEECDSCSLSLKNLPNLDYLPKLHQNLVLDGCASLKSLAGCPSTLDGDFVCLNCDQITSLKYAPKRCDNCRISLKNLPNLNFLPVLINGLDLTGCASLKTLEGGPTELVDDFVCMNCDQITSLKYAPKLCKSCYITLKNLPNLDYVPKVNLDLVIINCPNLKSLVGCQDVINGCFRCEDCKKLTSLVGAPSTVKYDFHLGNLNVKSLEGCPKTVRTFVWQYAPFSWEEIRKACDVKLTLIL